MTSRDMASDIASDYFMLGSGPWKSMVDAIERAIDAAVAVEREKLEYAVEGLRCAILAAFDGPEEPVGSHCAESYKQWRKRMEDMARSARRYALGGAK